MANIRGGVFTLRTASRLKKDDNWYALSDIWITSSPPIVTSGLVLNLDAGNTASYPGSGTTWGDLSGISGISTATGALPIYNTTDNGVVKGSGTRTDANASSLVLAIPMDGANNGTTFTDESANIKGSGSAKTITRNGDTKTLTAVSKFYGSSGFFDGTGDYLSIPAGSSFPEFTMGTSDYTIEMWFNPFSLTGSDSIFSIGNVGSLGGDLLTLEFQESGKLHHYVGASSQGVGGPVCKSDQIITTNSWNHVAVQRSGNIFTMYLNGVIQSYSITSAATILQANNVYIGSGSFDLSGRSCNGYIQDFRVYKGVAKYTANFTPPGNPNNATLTNGPTYSSANGGSIVFDGTNDYVTAPLSSQFEFGTGEFAVEAWVNLASTSTINSRILGIGDGANGGSPVIYTGWSLNVTNLSGPIALRFQRYDGTSTIYEEIIPAFSTGKWFHFVATRNASNTLTLYSNGVAISTTASVTQSYNSVNSEPLYSGIFYDGNAPASYKYANFRVSNARIYKGKSLTAAEVSQNYNALASRFGLEKPARYTDGIAPPNTGYFGGGFAPGVRSTMDKVTYSSDTTAAVPSAALSGARYGLAATGNSTNGYFGGGNNPPVVTMDKVTYSSDTTAAVPGANLTLARRASAATGNSTAGYFGGGYAAPTYSTMDKVTYSTDTTAAVPGANLTSARGSVGATGNSTNGYFGGGFPGSGSVTTMDKVNYSTDTTAVVPGANLSLSRFSLAATGNSTNGYFGGGSPGVSRMDKVTYSTDTTAAVPGAALSVGRDSPGATGNSTNGYFGGGNTGSFVSTMDKVTYASDTTAAVPGANLSVARYSLAASSARANALPQPPAPTPTPTTTLVNVPAPNTGYFGGGLTGGPVATMDKVTYSTDTRTTVPTAALSVARYDVAATGNSTNGYFGGGGVSIMDKVTYSSDTTAAVPGANLTFARNGPGATGNSTAGYFGGGNGGFVATMDKVTYSTDTTAAVPGADSSVARGQIGATGNSTNGYFGGGNGGPGATMDKVTYSTDTTAAVPGANLSVGRYGPGATGNSTNGYFGGGWNGGGLSTMDKVTYSSDTTAAVPGANLTVGRAQLAATGNSTNGYFGGGILSGFPLTALMDKVTYATDTTAAVPGANLSSDVRLLGAASARANALPQPTAQVQVPNIV